MLKLHAYVCWAMRAARATDRRFSPVQGGRAPHTPSVECCRHSILTHDPQLQNDTPVDWHQRTFAELRVAPAILRSRLYVVSTFAMINLVRLVSTTLNKYQSASRRLMSQAGDELERGDVQHASEKGWGRCRLDRKGGCGRKRLGAPQSRLAASSRGPFRGGEGGRYIGRLFDVASSLHITSYENWNSAIRVRRG